MRDPTGRSMSPPVLWPVHRNSCVQDFWCFAVCQRHSFACRFVSSWSNDCAVLNDCYWWRKSGEWLSSDQLLLLLSMVIPRVGSAIYLSTNTYPQLNWFCYTVYGSYREIDNIQRYALTSAESKTCRAVDEIPNNRKEYIPDRGRGPFFKSLQCFSSMIDR